MKKLIFVGGTMGVGKTTVGKLLKEKLPRCVYLDGDWCWNASPFVVTEETKRLMLDNIQYLLGNFLACSEFSHVVLTWVMHEQKIVDALLDALRGHKFLFYQISLVCSPQTLEQRLWKDISAGLRSEDVTKRSVPRLPLYAKLCGETIQTDGLSAEMVAERICTLVLD